LEHIRSFSKDSVLIKSADVISNLSELLHDYAREGEGTWDRFNASKKNFLENAQRVISSLLRPLVRAPLG
jgi:hypothetical protein